MPDDPWGAGPADPVPVDTECINCDAPGGYPYCSTGCEIADNPDDPTT